MKSGLMLKKGIECTGKPPKAIAREINYSVDAIYSAVKGKRKIPLEARKALSEMHILMGLAVARQVTGYNIFDYIQVDRHPQNLLRLVEKEDAEADQLLKPLGWRIIGKQKHEDLTEDDKAAIRAVGKELLDDIKAKLNFIIELEDRFRVGLISLLTDKKEKAVAFEPTAT